MGCGQCLRPPLTCPVSTQTKDGVISKARSTQLHLCPTWTRVNPLVAPGQEKRAVPGMLRWRHLQGLWAFGNCQGLCLPALCLSKVGQAHCCRNLATSFIAVPTLSRSNSPTPMTGLSTQDTGRSSRWEWGRDCRLSEQEAESEPEGPTLVGIEWGLLMPPPTPR